MARGLAGGEKKLCDPLVQGARGATTKPLPARLWRKHGACKAANSSGGVGCPGHCPFGFQGDQRDEEEETQMKKSESEVEVRAGKRASEVGGARLLWACPHPSSMPLGGSGHYCPAA